jgi:Flp pilus assembly protein TadD
MKPLQPPDSHHLSSALGWLGLGDWREAYEELKKIAPELRAHPDVLVAGWHIYARSQNWNMADEIARELLQIQPQEPQYWIWHAYSTRRMAGGGIPKAKVLLGKAQQLIPQEPLISYNLGCYECQLGNLEAAWTWLEIAFNSGDPKAFKSLALEDPDLEPLWRKIRAGS